MSDNVYTTPDEAEAYARGYARAQRNHDRAAVEARIAAFGAIRRAAEVAHEHERQAELYRNDEWEPFRDIEELQCARAIRRAIRAAIGSPKV